MLAYKDGRTVRLESRNRVDHTRRFPDLAAAVAALPGRTLVLGGEVAIFDRQLRSRFDGLRGPDPEEVATPPLLMVFDLLYRAGRDLTKHPLRERRSRLEDLVVGCERIFPVRRLTANGLVAWGRGQVASQRDRLKTQLDDVDARLGRLVQALVNGGPMETVVAQIKVEEECKRTLTAEYDSLDGASAPEAFDYASIVRELRERTADVQAVLSRQTTQARQMQPKLLDGKIDVEPGTLDGRRGSRLSGRLNVGRLRRTEVLRAIEATTSDEANSPTVVAPTGFEPVFQP